MLALMQYALIFYDFQLILARMSLTPAVEQLSAPSFRRLLGHEVAHEVSSNSNFGFPVDPRLLMEADFA